MFGAIESSRPSQRLEEKQKLKVKEQLKKNLLSDFNSTSEVKPPVAGKQARKKSKSFIRKDFKPL